MKAKTKFTKLWSILLALAMVVGMLPTIAPTLLNAAKTFIKVKFGFTKVRYRGIAKNLHKLNVLFACTNL